MKAHIYVLCKKVKIIYKTKDYILGIVAVRLRMCKYGVHWGWYQSCPPCRLTGLDIMESAEPLWASDSCSCTLSPLTALNGAQTPPGAGQWPWDQWLNRNCDHWPIRCQRSVASETRQCPVRQCSVNDTRRAVQDKESEKNPFLVTIKADLVHLAIRVFNFINIMMIIFSLDKFFH